MTRIVRALGRGLRGGFPPPAPEDDEAAGRAGEEEGGAGDLISRMGERGKKG